VTSAQTNTSRALLATCVAAAARAAEVIRERSSDRHTIDWETKARADFVTEVDRAAERAITALVHERHPGAQILGEELTPSVEHTGELTFVVDPLDGTTNFLHGFPWYAVSIAAMEEGQLSAGAVLNVSSGELFTATAGGGARLNGQPIQVSPITDASRALIGTGFPFKEGSHTDEYLRMMSRVMRETAGIRRPGSASLDLADVACGRFEGFWELSLAPWDIAAGLLLVREAGGVVTNIAGEPCPVAHTSLVAGNPTMHKWLLNALR
jgi:myo-inositol-1(or 4)-monophosphatase